MPTTFRKHFCVSHGQQVKNGRKPHIQLQYVDRLAEQRPNVRRRAPEVTMDELLDVRAGRGVEVEQEDAIRDPDDC